MQRKPGIEWGIGRLESPPATAEEAGGWSLGERRDRARRDNGRGLFSGLDIGKCLAQNRVRGGARVQFTVGLKLKGKTDHIAVDAEDALIAALKVKTEHPEAVITYVRQQNRRGDARHPSHALVENMP